MSYNVTTYPQGTFSWADFFSTDIEASKKFLIGLFGWTSVDMPTGVGRPNYTMFYLGDKTVAGGSPTFMPNMPSVWNSYITVNNVEEITASALVLGATITMAPMDVLDSGKMSTIQDPTGATVSLWQPKKHIGSGIVNTVGAMCWNELYTTDVNTAETFYGKLFNWTFESSPDMGNYIVIKNNGRSNGGVMPITPTMGPMPPNWTVYFTVEDINTSVQKAKTLQGVICLEPKDISVGKVAMVADPAGATFMLMEMSVPPEEWIE